MSTGAQLGNRVGDDTSSSQGLSSPPSANSPSQYSGLPTDDVHPAALSRALQSYKREDEDGTVKSEHSAAARSTGMTKRPRKKRDSDNTTTTKSIVDPDKPKKTRAPRGTSAAYLKRQAKLREEQERARQASEGLQAPAPPKPADPPPTSGPSLPSSNYNNNNNAFPTQSSAQNGNHEAIQKPNSFLTNHFAPPPRPASGQNYDPVRSSTAPRPTSPMPAASTPPKPYKQPGASASPSISSLIDPPGELRPRDHHLTSHPPSHRDSDTGPITPPEAKRLRLSPQPNINVQRPSMRSTTPEPSSLIEAKPSAMTAITAMEVDTESSTATKQPQVAPKKPTPNASTGVSSTAHSPKPSRPAKEAPLALPTGSGLLSGSVFGSGDLDSGGPEKNAPTVVLSIPLSGQNQYVNFARLAEERYGFNALHPRLAAQKERLARVAAAGAALENAHKNGTGGGSSLSADEKSVDLSNDEADDSNVEMGGMNDKSAAEDGAGGDQPPTKQRKKRVMKEDMYDKDDDFVDDTELAWEEQAAVSVDGFFVYSGMLVPDGEEAKVERSEPPPRRGGRGRGRGGGPGSRGGRVPGSSRGGEGGGRGGARKPRTTKADKERMEREKSARETLAPLASKPVGYQVHPQGQAQAQTQMGQQHQQPLLPMG